jgi:hypothetical protein
MYASREISTQQKSSFPSFRVTIQLTKYNFRHFLIKVRTAGIVFKLLHLRFAVSNLHSSLLNSDILSYL